MLEHSDARVYHPCEVGNGSAQGFQSHSSSQFFIPGDVSQLRHGLAHVRRVPTPKGPNEDPVSFTSDLTQAIDAIPSFVQGDVAQRLLPVLEKVALGTIVRRQGNGIATIAPRMRSETFEAPATIQQHRTILTRVTEVSAVNTTQETIELVGGSKSTEIHQGRTILVHERGEHRRPRPEHREGGGGLPGHRPRLAQTIVTGLCGRNDAASLGLTVHN